MDAMNSAEAAATGWRAYRCPVCSHTDGVVLAGADAVLIRCSHCDTPLEVSARGGGQTADTKVAQLERPSREGA